MGENGGRVLADSGVIANLLALVVIVGSLALYLEALALTPVQRPNDLIWSGVGLFYGLVLWIEGDRLQGGLLAGQVASVALLVWLGTQVWRLRQVEAGQRVAFLDLIRAVAKLAQQLQAPRPAGPGIEAPPSPAPEGVTEEAPPVATPPEPDVSPPAEAESLPAPGIAVEIDLETRPAELALELEPEPVAPRPARNALTNLIGLLQGLVRRAPRPAESREDRVDDSDDRTVTDAPQPTDTIPTDLASAPSPTESPSLTLDTEENPPTEPTSRAPDPGDGMAVPPEPPASPSEPAEAVSGPTAAAESSVDIPASEPAPVSEDATSPADPSAPSEKSADDSAWPPPPPPDSSP